MIPAGTVHAIGAGVLLAEIQQMSDATFRVFDWNRVGPDGKPRQLHIEQALESTDFEAGPVSPFITEPIPIESGTRELLPHCPFFSLERYKINRPIGLGDPERFTIVMALEGSAEIEDAGGATTPLGFGETVLLPASVGVVQVRPHGSTTLITCVVP